MQMSHTLLPTQVQESQDIHCFAIVVRVVLVRRGPRTEKVMLFYGRVRELQWDPRRFQWPKGKPLMEYSTKMGSELLCTKWLIPNIPRLRWLDTLLMGFVF
jgi:hypothetical protein